jgi:hypothetical protein
MSSAPSWKELKSQRDADRVEQRRYRIGPVVATNRRPFIIINSAHHRGSSWTNSATQGENVLDLERKRSGLTGNLPVVNSAYGHRENPKEAKQGEESCRKAEGGDEEARKKEAGCEEESSP